MKRGGNSFVLLIGNRAEFSKVYMPFRFVVFIFSNAIRNSNVMSHCRSFVIRSLQISSGMQWRNVAIDRMMNVLVTERGMVSPLFNSARPIFSKPILVFTRHGCYFVGCVSSFTLYLLCQVGQTVFRAQVHGANKFMCD